MGADLRWERLNVVQPPSPTGDVHVQQPVYRSPWRCQHRNTARELSPRPGAAVLDRPAAGRDPQSRPLSGVLRPRRLASVRPHHRAMAGCDTRSTSLRPRRAIRSRCSICKPSSSSISAVTASRVRRASCTSSTSAHVWASSAASRTRPGADWLRDGVDRDGRHHHAVHDARVSVPADGVAADAGQHHAGLHAGGRAEGRADSADPRRRSRARRVLRGSRSGLGLRAAVEHVHAAGAHGEHRGGSGLHRIEDHARRSAGYEPESVDRGPACAGRLAAAARGEPVLRHRSRGLRRWAIRPFRLRS